MVEKNIETDEEESSLVAEAKRDAKVQKKATEGVSKEEEFDDEDELGDDDIDEIEEE